MKRFTLALLVLLMPVVSGCRQNPSTDSGITSEKNVYHSDTSAEDCYLCGGGIEDMIPYAWGQNNVALISLNTFEIDPIEINRYDVDGQLIEEPIGAISLGGSGSKNGGFSTNMMLEYDRGYAKGSLFFHNVSASDKM